MASLAAVNEQLKVNNEENITGHMMVAESVDRLSGLMNSFINMLKMQQMDMLEVMRERQAEQAAAAGPRDNTGGDGGLGLGPIAAIIAGISSLVTGFFLGIGDSIRKLLSLAKLDGPIARIGDVILDFFRTIRGRISGMGTRVRGVFTSAIDDVVEIVADIGRFIKNGVFGRILAGITDLLVFPFEGLFGAAGEGNILTKIFNAVARPFNMIFDMVKSAVSVLDPIIEPLKAFGRTIGRLFAPFAIIMTAYDTVKGAIAGFEEDGAIGAIAGAIKGLLNSIIGMPLDLLKGAVAYILQFFGADSAAEYLRGFSFTEMITGFVDTVKDFFKSLYNGVVGGFMDAIGYVAEVFGFERPTFEGFDITSGETPTGMSGDLSLDETAGGVDVVQQAIDKKVDSSPTRLESRVNTDVSEAVSTGSAELRSMEQRGAVSMPMVSAPTVNNNNSSSTSTYVGGMAGSFDNMDPLLVSP